MNGPATDLDLFITHVDHVGPFLKLLGVHNHETLTLVSKRIEALLPACFAVESNWTMQRQLDFLIPGLPCIYKQTLGSAPGDYTYMRANVINASVESRKAAGEKVLLVKIEFVDNGYNETVDSRDLFFPKQPILLQNFPLLRTHFIMLGICASWDQEELSAVKDILLHQYCKLVVKNEICGQKFVSVFWKEFNLADFLVQQKQIGAPITPDLVYDHCKTLWKEEPSHLLTGNNNDSKYNNNNIQNVAKTPTDVAREQLAAKRSLAARLEHQRTVSAGMLPRLLNESLPEHSGGQFTENVQLQPPNISNPTTLLANTVNIIPSMGNMEIRPNLQMPNYAPYYRPNMPIIRSTISPMVPEQFFYMSKAPSVRHGKIIHPIYKVPSPSTVWTNRFTPPSTATPGTRPAFKSSSLTVGLTYDVYVSYVDKGPKLFWVQLKAEQKDLEMLMKKIERTRLLPMNSAPPVGTACVARFSEDGNCYRSLISGSFQTKCRIVYIDYGNTELVELRDLYHITEDLLDLKPFAYRFSLAKIEELEPYDESITRVFKGSSLYMNFQLTVQAAASVGALQTCNLLNREQINMLDFLKNIKKSRLCYTPAEHLKNEDVVEIRYIDSPSQFYVQKVKKIEQFQKLMDEMFTYYNANQKVPQQLILGAPCIVRFDQEWYRAEIVRVDGPTITVRHVDFGFEQSVTLNLLSFIAKQHMEMPRQAIKCCLKGFENSELSVEKITDQFEMLAEDSNVKRRAFTVRIFRIEPDGTNVVNLLNKNLNVMKQLYKLSMPFEKYLSMEKGEFNTSKVQSIASSANVEPLYNSTSVEGDNSMTSQKHNKSSDWDKHSSGSAKSCRDSQSSSKSKRQPVSLRRSQQKNQRNRDGPIDLKFDSQSVSSYTSRLSSPRKGARQNARMREEAQQEASTSSCSTPRKEPQQRQNQRSQNAPQGFAQKPQRQKSTLNGASVTKKTNENNKANTQAPPPPPAQPKPEKFIPLDQKFKENEIKMPLKELGSISWWVSPFQFFIVLKSTSSKGLNLHREMADFYRQKRHQPLQLKPASSVVVFNRKDNMFVRGTILNYNHLSRKYRVLCIDVGNILLSASDDLWPVEERFAELPPLAIRCSFGGVISNYEHLYIVDRMDSFVPTDSKVECEFLEKHSSKNGFIVNLIINGNSLKDMLVKSNILTRVEPELCLELLAGQQIRGKFNSIKDLANFKVRLNCSNTYNFLCTYDDSKFIKANSNLAARFKEYYEGKSFAFNVKDVCENNLIHLRPIVPLWQEDKDSFICPFPIIFSTFKATVVYVSKAYRVHVHPAVIQNDMKQLLDGMYEHYEKNGNPLLKLHSDQICAARSKDGNWYRARVLSKNAKSGNIEVYYIDYGNTETIGPNDIKKLEKKFYVDKSGYSVAINLPFGRISNNDKLKLLVTNLLEEKIVTIKPIDAKKGHLIADVILENNQNIVDALKAEKLISGRDIEFMRKQLDKEKAHMLEFIETVDLTNDEDDYEKKKEEPKQPPVIKSPTKVQKQDQKPEENLAKPQEKAAPTATKSLPASKPPTSSNDSSNENIANNIKAKSPNLEQKPKAEPAIDNTPKPAAVTKPADKYGHLDSVVLSHCDNPAQFWVHNLGRLEGLQRLQENLQIVAPALPQLMNVVKGAECISLYSVDKQWYRAKILDAELMVLQFIDFGNTDCVSDTTDVKESLWSHIPPFCSPCALPVYPNGTVDWVDAANSVFNESYKKFLHYELLTRFDNHKTCYLNLYIEGVDIAKKLIKDGYAKPMEYVNSNLSCYVSHVNSVTDFYIQLEQDSNGLDLIERYLRDAEQRLKPLEEFKKSIIIAALFEDDGLWYRAELLEKLPENRFKVRFIDYGNTSVSSKCLLLTEEIANLPALSKKCSLQLPDNYEAWTDEAEAKFVDITGEGELIFTTKLVKPAINHVIIDLLLDDDNIIDKLLPLCTQKQVEPSIPVEEAQIKNSTNSTQIRAIITHVESPLKLYLQFMDNWSIIEDISQKLNSMKLESVTKENEIEEGSIFVAKYPKDNDFYRVRLVGVLPASAYRGAQYQCVFIDYGDLAFVDELFKIPVDMMDIPPLAKLFTLQLSEKWTKYTSWGREALDALVDGCNGEVSVEYVNSKVSPPVVQLTTINKNALNISEQLEKLLAEKSLALGEDFASSECIISGGKSPKSFYVQLKRNSAELDLIVKTLETTKLRKFSDPVGNETVIGYSQEDRCYYRCLIKTLLPNNDGYKVFLNDYGNFITVKEVYHVPAEISSLPNMALHCSLSEIPENVDDKKLEDAFTTLIENHFGEVYQIDNGLTDDIQELYNIKLSINYKDVALELANILAGVPNSVVAELHICEVSHYNSPTSFYVQMEDDFSALEEMANKLAEGKDTFPVFTKLEVGELCAAFYSEDDNYYRAKIIKVLDDGKCEVHFIDYGNNAVTEQLRQLPEILAKPCSYCKHCKLESGTIAKCNITDLQAFIDSHCTETFQVEILAVRDDTQVVRLFYQNMNICEKLRLKEN